MAKQTLCQDKHIAELLSAYIDDRLSAAERLQAEAHLPGCPTCQAELASLRATVVALRELPAVPLPRTFYVYPEQVAARAPIFDLSRLFRPGWVYAPLRLATVAVSLLFVVVVAGDALTQTMMPQAAAPVPQVMRAPARDEAVPTKPALAIAPMAAPPPAPTVVAKAVPEATQPTTPPAAPLTPTPAPAPAAAPTPPPPGAADATRSMAPTPPISRSLGMPPQPTPSASPALQPKAAEAGPSATPQPRLAEPGPAATPSPAAQPTVGPETAVVAGAAEPTATPAPQPSPTERPVGETAWAAPTPASREGRPAADEAVSPAPLGLTGLPLLRWLEVGLGALAAGLVILTLRARRHS